MLLQASILESMQQNLCLYLSRSFYHVPDNIQNEHNIAQVDVDDNGDDDHVEIDDENDDDDDDDDDDGSSGFFFTSEKTEAKPNVASAEDEDNEASNAHDDTEENKVEDDPNELLEKEKEKKPLTDKEKLLYAELFREKRSVTSRQAKRIRNKRFVFDPVTTGKKQCFASVSALCCTIHLQQSVTSAAKAK